MSNMVKVKVFYDGTYEIEEANGNAATQHLYIAEKGKFGEAIICSKEKMNHYKDDLCVKIMNKNICEITNLESANQKLGKILLTNID